MSMNTLDELAPPSERSKGKHFNATKTHCKRGHLLSGDNLRIDRQSNRKGGFTVSRQCLACERARQRSAATRAKAKQTREKPENKLRHREYAREYMRAYLKTPKMREYHRLYRARKRAERETASSGT